MKTPIGDGEGMIYNSKDVFVEVTGTSKLWLGKDYTNFIVKDFDNLESPYQDLVDRSTTPRMPWHDVGIMVQDATARDIARHFIQRWNAIKVKYIFSEKIYQYPSDFSHFSDIFEKCVCLKIYSFIR